MSSEELTLVTLDCHTHTHTHTQITYMESDMDKGLANILCTKIDEHAGDWPSGSFVEFFQIAKKCVEPKMHLRQEIAQVSSPLYVCLIPNLFLFFACSTKSGSVTKPGNEARYLYST